MEPILEIRGLTKTYRGGFTALNGVDLSIRKGEIFALLGPNRPRLKRTVVQNVSIMSVARS